MNICELSNDVLKYCMANFLETRDLISFARTCKRINGVVRKVLAKRKKAVKRSLTRQRKKSGPAQLQPQPQHHRRGTKRDGFTKQGNSSDRKVNKMAKFVRGYMLRVYSVDVYITCGYGSMYAPDVYEFEGCIIDNGVVLSKFTCRVVPGEKIGIEICAYRALVPR